MGLYTHRALPPGRPKFTQEALSLRVSAGERGRPKGDPAAARSGRRPGWLGSAAIAISKLSVGAGRPLYAGQHECQLSQLSDKVRI